MLSLYFMPLSRFIANNLGTGCYYMALLNNIFPAEIAATSLEKHIHDYRSRSPVLYLLLLGLFIIAIILLFIIRVDISIRSNGIFKPARERIEIRSLVSATVDSVFVEENDHVTAGQPLIKLVSGSVIDKNKSLDTQINELLFQQQDLLQLLKGKTSNLKSKLYIQDVAVYNRQRNEVGIRMNTALKTYNRYRKLYKEKIISTAEFEKHEAEYRSIQNEMVLLKEQQRNKWQSELTSLNLQLHELNARQTLFAEEQDQYTIRAATSGFIQQFKGLEPGSSVTAGEQIGEVSPDSGLLAEIYVTPKDIGYIHEGLPVRMQVDAFDYNIWGMVPGRVESVSGDVFIENGKPLFKIRCSISKPVLTLRNGYKGILKKGMTVQARFLVTRRTLFQLLFDKADDWLNPNLKPDEK
jgi:multidrug resistance efflux pump